MAHLRADVRKSSILRWRYTYQQLFIYHPHHIFMVHLWTTICKSSTMRWRHTYGQPFCILFISCVDDAFMNCRSYVIHIMYWCCNNQWPFVNIPICVEIYKGIFAEVCLVLRIWCTCYPRKMVMELWGRWPYCCLTVK